MTIPRPVGPHRKLATAAKGISKSLPGPEVIDLTWARQLI